MTEKDTLKSKLARSLKTENIVSNSQNFTKVNQKDLKVGSMPSSVSALSNEGNSEINSITDSNMLRYNDVLPSINDKFSYPYHNKIKKIDSDNPNSVKSQNQIRGFSSINKRPKKLIQKDNSYLSSTIQQMTSNIKAAENKEKSSSTIKMNALGSPLIKKTSNNDLKGNNLGNLVSSVKFQNQIKFEKLAFGERDYLSNTNYLPTGNVITNNSNSYNKSIQPVKQKSIKNLANKLSSKGNNKFNDVDERIKDNGSNDTQQSGAININSSATNSQNLQSNINYGLNKKIDNFQANHQNPTIPNNLDKSKINTGKFVQNNFLDDRKFSILDIEALSQFNQHNQDQHVVGENAHSNDTSNNTSVTGSVSGTRNRNNVNNHPSQHDNNDQSLPKFNLSGNNIFENLSPFNMFNQKQNFPNQQDPYYQNNLQIKNYPLELQFQIANNHFQMNHLYQGTNSSQTGLNTMNSLNISNIGYVEKNLMGDHSEISLFSENNNRYKKVKQNLDKLLGNKSKAFYLLIESDFLIPNQRLRLCISSKIIYPLTEENLLKDFSRGLIKAYKQIENKYFNISKIKEEIIQWTFKPKMTTQISLNHLTRSFEQKLPNLINAFKEVEAIFKLILVIFNVNEQYSFQNTLLAIYSKYKVDGISNLFI